MIDSIELELEALNSAGLFNLVPAHLYNYFKEELNDKIIQNLINDLNSLIQTIDANNSFKILSLSDTKSTKTKQNELSSNSSNQDLSILSDLSDSSLNGSKSLLAEISNRLSEVLANYDTQIKTLIGLFEKQSFKQLNLINIEKAPFPNKQELLVYQRAILVQRLSNKHYDLFSLVFRNVFDFYQKSLSQDSNEENYENEEEYLSTSCNMQESKSIDEKMSDSSQINSTFNNQLKYLKQNNDLLIQNFERINQILFDLELFDHLCGDIVVGVVQNKIKKHIESTSIDNYQESFLNSFENWLEKIIIGWIKLIYLSSIQFAEEENTRKKIRSNESNISRIDYHLLNYKAQLAHFMYTHYADIRIRRLFDIVIDFPDSKNAIDDLKICLEKTDLRTLVICSLKKSIEQRLLHPGVNTSDIITAYVSAIKALLCLDPSGVLMENVCEPLKKYLRNRDDTVKCIVSNLTDDGESSNDLMEEFCKDLGVCENSNDAIDSTTSAPMQLAPNLNELIPNNEENRIKISKLQSWQMWTPDPIDAVNSASDGSMIGSKSNIISMLVNIYGSKDLFVNEYKTLLGDRLLSSFSFNMEKEIRNLELLKLRFGDSNLFSCEAMLKDISESKRINTNILEQLKQKNINKIESFDVNSNSLKCIILSEQFWPKLKEEKIEMPQELKLIQENFMKSYEAFKGNRTLIWKNYLGQVTLDLEINGKILEFNVTPIQAAVIMKFQEKETWNLQELSQSMKMCSFSLKKKLSFWKMQGLVRQIDQCESKAAQPTTSNEEQNETNAAAEVYTLVKDAGKLNKSKSFIEYEEETEKTSQSNEILKEQELSLYWNYTQSMLRGCGCLPIDRIHTWLKMYANSDLTLEQVKYLVDIKTKEQLLKYNAGLYRLNK